LERKHERIIGDDPNPRRTTAKLMHAVITETGNNT
jgi:hypothetical protein